MATTATPWHAGKAIASLKDQQKDQASEAFKRMDIDGRGELYAAELEAVFSGASILENAVLGGEADQAAAENERAFVQTCAQTSGISEDDWIAYLRVQKSTLGPHNFNKFVEDIVKHAAKPETQETLKSIKTNKKASQLAEKQAELAEARKWTDQTARRLRPDAPSDPTGLRYEEADDDAELVPMSLKPKQPPLSSEEQMVATQYAVYSAQRAQREQEDEQDAMELLETTQRSPGTSTSRNQQRAGNSPTQQPGSPVTAGGPGDAVTPGTTSLRMTFASDSTSEDAELPPLRLYLMQPAESGSSGGLGWDPPTTDVDCIEAVVYLQFCRRIVPSLRFDVSLCANEYVAPNRSLPSMLIQKEQALVPRADLMASIKRLLVKPCVDDECPAQFEGASAQEPNHATVLLNDALCGRPQLDSLERSICALVEGSLKPLALHLRWVDDEAAMHSQLAYARGLPFLQRLVLPKQERARVLEQLTSLEARNKLHVLERADQALQALSSMLGDTEFFYGDHPTAIDAKVFAHLLPLMREHPGSTEHQAITRSCWPSLYEYVTRICKLMQTLEETCVQTEGLHPVERQSTAKRSNWVEQMVAATEAEGKRTEAKIDGWFNYFKMMSPLITAGGVFVGFVLLRRVRAKLE